MKKSLFLLASLGVLSLSQAQTLYVKKFTEVKVKPGALLYVQGKMKVDSSVKGLTDERTGGYKTGEYVSNEGNVRITGDLEMGNTVNGSDFVNELLSGGQYGQLIVDSGSDDNTGNVSSIVKVNQDFGYYPFAIPFKDQNFLYEAATLYGIKTSEASKLVSFMKGYKPGRGGDTQRGFDRERFKNLMFIWDNNAGQPVLQQLGFPETFPSNEFRNTKPGAYYALNVGFSGKGKPNANAVSYLFGVPQKQDLDVTVKRYKVGNNKDYNKFGEQYGSYVFDFTQSVPAGFNTYGQGHAVVAANGFGDNIFLLGNPFTSNINLFGDKTNDSFGSNNVVAIVQFGKKSTYQENVNDKDNDGTSSDSYGGSETMTAATGDGAGDAQALYVRPYQTFAVKLKGETTGSYTFKFTNGMKTFDIPTGVNPINNMLSARAKANGVKLNQVGLDLYDNKGFTGVKTYVVASDIYDAAKSGKGTELTNVAIKDKDTALYTLQEDANGSVDAKLANDKAYINGINADKYVGKPIHVVLQNGKGQYTIKARLNQELANNKNAFYFEDKKEGKVLKVGKDFSYTFNAEGTDKDRFVLYWAKTPKAELSKDLAKEVKSSSVVYKDAAGTYKVRFDKAIKKADVFVYNISGQLVNVAKAVDTASDYVVPVKGNSSIYVVKVVGDNGSVTTKKIIK